MKTIALSLIASLFLLIGTNGSAQTEKKSPETKKEKKQESRKQTAEQRADKQTKKMTEKLALTSEQQPKVKAILLERAKQLDKDKETCKGDGKCMQDAKRKRNKVAEEKLKLVLTADQFKKLQEIRKQAREKNKANKGGKPEKVKKEKANQPVQEKEKTSTEEDDDILQGEQ